MSRARRSTTADTPVLDNLECLILAQAVWELGADSWPAVVKVLQKHPLISRPKSFFTPQSCHTIYKNLMREAGLECVEDNNTIHAPSNLKLAQKHYQARLDELRELIAAEETKFKTIVVEIEEIRAGLWDDKITAELSGTPIQEKPDATIEVPAAPTDEVFGGSDLTNLASPLSHRQVLSVKSVTPDIGPGIEGPEAGAQQPAGQPILPEKRTETAETPEEHVLDDLSPMKTDSAPPGEEDVEETREDQSIHSDVGGGPSEYLDTGPTVTRDVSAPPLEGQQLGEEEPDQPSNQPTEVRTPAVDAPLQQKQAEVDPVPEPIPTPTPEQEQESEPEVADSPARVPESEQHPDEAVDDDEGNTSGEEPLHNFRRSTRRRVSSGSSAPTPAPARASKSRRQGRSTRDSEMSPAADIEPAIPGAEELEKLPKIEEDQDAISVPPETTSLRRRDSKRKASFVGGVESPRERKRARDDSEPADEDEPGPSSNANRTRRRTEEQVALKRFQNVIGMLHSQISQHRNGNIFHNPIKNSEAPDYHEIVKRPMDLKTIKMKVKDGAIANSLEFQRDIFLMFANAMMYNRPGSDVHAMAEDMMLESEGYINSFRQTEGLVRGAHRI